MSFVVRQHVFDQQRTETKYTAVAAIVAPRTNPNADGVHLFDC